MKLFSQVLLSLSLVAAAVAHGTVTTPTPRALGPANLAACGIIVNTILKSDKYGPIENSAISPGPTYNATACHLFFCRGYQFEDNVNNTRVYAPGTSVPFHVDMEAHHTGFANVSVVNLATQTPIARLFTWPVYANDSLGPVDWPKNETDFTVVVPNLGTQCAKAGQCAIQWWWWGVQVKQTYESCVDFTQ
ncbi:hypothetical protein DFH08DRAFT_948172 [Mycena albidolilacea]|uniref:Chitin-binding type-4 domain-containing protein n=1 Tax=Mycena albidolilacea TaxID=1033008 RepID=A0AAD7AQK0_9AGAR|nr:hypothetical protein DFH08DRAFT_948172 [Mycena albidolilacea]